MRSIIIELWNWYRLHRRWPLHAPGSRVGGAIEAFRRSGWGWKLLCLLLAALIVREGLALVSRTGTLQPMPPAGERAHGVVED